MLPIVESIRTGSSSRTLYRGAAVIALVLSAAANVHAALVFSALRDGVWRLYHQSEPDAPPRPIPAQPLAGDQGAPRLSPDGKWVAFEITGGGLQVCPITGAGACRSVAVGSGYAVRPAWNPRTGALVLVHFTFKGGEEQSTIKLTGGDPAAITPLIEQTGIQDFPAVAPDGRRLAYTSWLTVMPYRGRVSVVQQLWTLELGTGRAGQLLLSNAGDIHPRWSPDGSRIAFSSNRTGRYELWTTSNAGTDLHRITDGPGDKTWPAWSPDGSRILFTHTRKGRSGLSLVRIDTGEIRPYNPFGPDSGIQLKDPDWRAVAD
ncbi:PD40 domain-containing protein [Candidatus Thiosymbion oneisti]|uniref:PD40 domain-containing protein n=1 Tax=Candidatus Thiosymbion oneisti TaxID=589554 RepID=UPI000B7CC420|nr:PD40 domain-containing protein [Candidatus Thiosymbion oneisti]